MAGFRKDKPFCLTKENSKCQTCKQSCPQCGSFKIWKDGLRYTAQGPVQRYICRSCGYRFSDPKSRRVFQDLVQPIYKGGRGSTESNSSDTSRHDQRILTKPLKSNPAIPSNCQICATKTKGAINLAKVETRQKKAMREGTRKTDEAYRKGKLVEFLWFLKKKGYKSANERFRNVRGLLALGADLWNPESVKRVLATDKKPQEDWTDGYKLQLCYAYTSFCEMEGLTWEMPAYKQEEKLPWIPLEEELDSLISAAGKVLGAYLQGLKDTGTDPGELGNLEWNDINSQNRTVNINRPVKGHSPRVLKVSRAFLDRVNSLPKKYGQYIWSYQSLRANYQRARKSAARRLANPRILQIELRTFRHWKGTMEYHKTKDILHVKQLLGHKRIENTMKYINLEGAIFEDEPQEFHVKVANNVKEAMELVEVGFDYVTGGYEDGGKIFRKRK